MVSIANASGHQGVFSDTLENGHSHNSLADELGSNEHLLRSPILNTGTLCSKDQLIKRFPGICFVVLYMLLLVTFEVFAFICYDVLHLKVLGGIEEPFALLTVIHVFIWLLTFVYDRYLHFHHHVLRKFGYLNFFMETKELRRVPMMIFSLGNAALLIVVAFTESRASRSFPLVRIFQIVASIEVGICLVAKMIYFSSIRQFNRLKRMPDVYNNDIRGGLDTEMHNAPEIGFSDTDGLDDVLEKQSEMIQYLQQHNTNLSKRIIELTQLLPKDEQQLILNTSNVNPSLYAPKPQV